VELEVLEAEVINVLYGGVDLKIREGIGNKGLELLEAFYVVVIHVHVCKHMNELSSLKTCYLR
jgi:hypothetical protein